MAPTTKRSSRQTLWRIGRQAQGSARAVGVASIDRVWLFVGAIAIHNIPEGLAIGVGFGQASSAGGTALASGIAAQNIPEGLVVAAALVAAGYGRPTAFAVAALSGLVEPVAARS